MAAVAQRGRRRSARRLGGLLLVALVAVVGVAAVIWYFTAHDAGTTAAGPAGRGAAATAGPGQALPGLGDRHLRPGERPGVRYDSSPPTSGPHVVVPVRRDAARLSDDQVLTALERGNVLLVYGSARPPAGLRALARRQGGAAFSPALARTGQAVILARRPGTTGVVALAWRHLQRGASAGDPALERFIEAWLGLGAPGAPR